VLYYNKGQRADRTLEEHLNRGGGGERRHFGVLVAVLVVVSLQ